MDLNETQEYLRRSAAANRELDTWGKVSIGMFVGAVVMAMALGEWSTADALGEEIPKIGGRLAAPLALVLFGAYHWRRRIVEKKLNPFWQALSAEEKEKVLELELKERR